MEIKINENQNEIASSYDVFISHATNDDTVARTVTKALENEGIKCWFAPRELSKEGDTSYTDSLIKAFYSVKVMLLIFSSSSNNSKIVMNEVNRAVSMGLHIIPWRIENIEPTNAMEFHLITSQWIDAYTLPLEKHVNLLKEAIKNFLVENKKQGNR